MATTINTALIRAEAAAILETEGEVRTIRQAVYTAAGDADKYEATMREIRAESWTSPGFNYIDGLDIYAGIPVLAGFEHVVEPGYLVACLREPPTTLDRIRTEASRAARNGVR